MKLSVGNVGSASLEKMTHLNSGPVRLLLLCLWITWGFFFFFWKPISNHLHPHFSPTSFFLFILGVWRDILVICGEAFSVPILYFAFHLVLCDFVHTKCWFCHLKDWSELELVVFHTHKTTTPCSQRRAHCDDFICLRTGKERLKAAPFISFLLLAQYFTSSVSCFFLCVNIKEPTLQQDVFVVFCLFRCRKRELKHSLEAKTYFFLEQWGNKLKAQLQDWDVRALWLSKHSYTPTLAKFFTSFELLSLLWLTVLLLCHAVTQTFFIRLCTNSRIN